MHVVMEHEVNRSKLASLALLLCLPGCRWMEKMSDAFDNLTTVKVDNPVVGPPPPRLAMTDDRVSGSGSTIVRAESGTFDSKSDSKGSLDVQPVDYQNVRLSRNEELTDESVVALVDGTPIFASEVLEVYGRQIKDNEGKFPTALIQAEKRKIIKRDLPVHIDKRLLVMALRKMLKKEQLEQLDKQLDLELDARMKKMGANTPYELEQKLQEKFGLSVAAWRTHQEAELLAGQFLKEKIAKADREPTRRELLDFYSQHIDEYSFPASVKFQLIQVSFRKHGGKREAFAAFEKAVEALKRENGENFSVVARKYSDGPKAEQGGQWDWTRQGSLTDKSLDKLLFELPVGSISEPIVGDDAFRLVMVNERKAAGRIDFTEVQDKIKKAIKTSRLKGSTEEVLQELRSLAVIETIFDKDPAVKSTEALPFQ